MQTLSIPERSLMKKTRRKKAKSDIVSKALAKVFGEASVFIASFSKTKFHRQYLLTCPVSKVFLLSRLFSPRYGIGPEWEVQLIDQSDLWGNEWPVYFKIILKAKRGDTPSSIRKSKRCLVELIRIYTNQDHAFAAMCVANETRIAQELYKKNIMEMIQKMKEKPLEQMLTSEDPLELELGKFIAEKNNPPS